MADPANEFTPCCDNLKQALEDKFVLWDKQHATVFQDLAAGVVIPFTFCPWCGQEQPRTLSTSPAMLYRP